ncbi:MAG: SH3 domain-containing protein [Verrucomicrobia bacterium]|nr:SH3 domain-containing protein [Verrucomicrobiota bacterium]
MKTFQPLLGLAVAVFGFTGTVAKGGQTATVKENHVNVRGQPSLAGEVITQLKKGERVVVLEEIPVPKPKAGEPASWSRIQMPANTPVWVFASLIDPNEKTVKASRLNLRAGPGENFSVLGRLERGDTVKEIRTVEDWMEIETPEKAHAFVATELLSKPEPAAPPVLPGSKKTEVVSEPPRAEPGRPSPAANEPVAAPATLTPIDQPAPPVTEAPPTKPTPPPETTPATVTPAPTPHLTDVVPTPQPASPVAATAVPSPVESGPPPKRVVRREGIVRSTWSIQAPTYVELISPDTRRVINYLHTLDTELKLKDFRGKKIIVTGEEGIDSRWPKTPVLEVETIELAP